MRGRKPEKFQLKPKDKAYLRKLLRDGKTPWRIVRRAQILLQRAETNQGVGSLSEKFAQSASTIWRICQRYRDGDLQAALYDAPRAGRPCVFSQKATQIH
jgi:squalene cyclase